MAHLARGDRRLARSAVAHQRLHAELIQARLDETPADVPEPCLSVSHDVVLRSVNVAAVRLGLHLPDREAEGNARSLQTDW